MSQRSEAKISEAAIVDFLPFQVRLQVRTGECSCRSRICQGRWHVDFVRGEF